jgi:TonB-linked SusC/RagA family outer membrane protein
MCIVTVSSASTALPAQPYAMATPTAMSTQGQPREAGKSLKQTLAELEERFEVHIIYNANAVENKQAPQHFVPGQGIEKSLKDLLGPHKLQYEKLKEGVYVIILPKTDKQALRSINYETSIPTGAANGPVTSLVRNIDPGPGGLPAGAVEVAVSGRVTAAEDNTALPGVSVVVKGSTTGTITDSDGRYKLNVPGPESVLVFSFVGYTSQEVAVGNRTNIDIGLAADIKALSEVVVVGYGTQKKSQTTGAISSVGSKEIMELPITNARQALQGRAAGVDVIQTGSRPGGGVTVRIRGRRSINASNDPLYVVDGIPLAGNIDDINPNDIASMEVLKDASATAIYGSRGANGVVIITTRRGQAGKTVVSYDGYFGVSNALGKIDVMNGPEFAEYKRESRRAVNEYNDADPAADSKLFEAIELDGIAAGRSTDYQDYLLRTGSIQSHQVGISGGSEKTQFAVSGNVFRDVGIIKEQDFTRYTFRVNLDHQITNRIKVGVSTLGVYSVNNGADSPFPNIGTVDTYSGGFNPYGGALQENPLGKPYDENGKLIFLPTSDGLRTNPIAEIIPGANIAQTRTVRLFNSIYGEWSILDGLKYRVNFGPDFTNQRFGRFTGSLTNANRAGNATARTDNGQRFNYTVENILTYTKNFNQTHNLGVTALHSIQRDNFENTSISVNGVPVESQEYYNLGQASIINGVGSQITQWTLQSFMGRINYDFKEKYLLTVTGRYDGSSRFGENTKYGFFPSVAAGWNISKENFMQGLTWLDQLKLRASYGAIGNTGINPYQTQGLLARTSYAFGTTPGYGFRQGTLANPDLKWETTTTANAGIDFSVWAGRVSGSLEYYQADTRDLLLYDQLPLTGGFDRVLKNVGRTRNRGLELTLSTVNVNAENGFRWSTDLQFTRNREEIVELFNGKVDDVGNSRFIGQPLTAYYDKEKIGIWQLGEEDLAKSYGQKVGEIKIKDQNEDGKIDDVNDRVIIGSQIPKWAGGITNRFEFKGFDLSFFIYARVGSTIRSGFHRGFNSLAGRYNNLDIDYWTPNNPTNEFPRPNKNQEFPIHQTTLQYFDGSFVKVRNINLGYNFPASLVEKLKMSSLRAYVSIQQPFIFAEYRTKYKGIDPETTDEVNENQTPSVRQMTFGLNVKF